VRPPGLTGAAREVSEVQLSREMSRREIVFERPTPFWQSGLSVGNGDLQGSVFGGGAGLSVLQTKSKSSTERRARKETSPPSPPLPGEG
jgi:P pilus assembly chaperone PapD